jgi:glycosyltransferase involved in cell wall biosynthesis
MGVDQMASRRTVLYLERNVDGTIGGSYRSLLYLIKGLPKEVYRPIAVFYRNHHLVEEFEKSGCRVVLLQYPKTIRLLDQFPTVRRWRILSPVNLAARVLQKVLNFSRGAVVMFGTFLRLLIKERVCLVHLNNGVMSGTELLLASRLLGVRTVVHQRGIGTLPSSFARVRRLIDHVICVSDAARESLISQGLSSERATTIHNGIDPDAFRASIKRSPRAVRRDIGLSDDVLIVGNIGMIKEWKGQLVLVQAMARVVPKHPDVRCVIVGGIADQHGQDAAYLRQIQQYIEDHGLNGVVQLVDYQPNVAEFMQILDVMVHSSIDPEPFSRSVIEGMTLGRAMIGTRTGGTPEAIEDGVSGMLVRPNDSDELADKIERLLRDPELRRTFGRSAEERVRGRFMIQTNIAATQRVYDQLLGKVAGSGC